MSSQGNINLDKYAKKVKIGEGSFYKVYKVIDNDTNSVYAAKITIDKKNQENSFRQYRIISTLNHPSIIKYIGYSPVDFKNKPKSTIISEYYSNGSLDSLLDLDRKGMSLQIYDNTKKLIIIYGIASGMSYLHSNKVLHMDLKPSNILLNENLFPIIAGFNLARYFDNFEKRINGTLAYISPEVLKNHEYTTKNDVYAFSMLLYEIVTGNEPFIGVNVYEIVYSVIQGIRPIIPDSISEQCQDLISRCWSEDPDERPTFEEITNIIKENPQYFVTGYFDKNIFNDYINYLK